MCQSDDSISIVSPQRFVSLRNQHKGTNLLLGPHFFPLKMREASLVDLNTLVFFLLSGITQPDFPPPLCRPQSETRFLWGFYSPTSSTSAFTSPLQHFNTEYYLMGRLLVMLRPCTLPCTGSLTECYRERGIQGFKR